MDGCVGHHSPLARWEAHGKVPLDEARPATSPPRRRSTRIAAAPLFCLIRNHVCMLAEDLPAGTLECVTPRASL